MDQTCLIVPVLPGKTADARDFMRELDADRNADYQASEQRIGIVKEAWYLARAGAGDQLVAHLESPDFRTALAMFPQSKNEFDLWFKHRLADATGLDLNTMALLLPDLRRGAGALSYHLLAGARQGCHGMLGWRGGPPITTDVPGGVAAASSPVARPAVW